MCSTFEPNRTQSNNTKSFKISQLFEKYVSEYKNNLRIEFIGLTEDRLLLIFIYDLFISYQHVYSLTHAKFNELKQTIKVMQITKKIQTN